MLMNVQYYAKQGLYNVSCHLSMVYKYDLQHPIWFQFTSQPSLLSSLFPLHRFDPDHFAPGSPHARRGAEFCPFGTNSPRKCPGYQFSYFEVTVFTSILLHRFNLVPVEGQNVEQVHGLVTEPKEEIYLYVRARE